MNTSNDDYWVALLVTAGTEALSSHRTSRRSRAQPPPLNMEPRHTSQRRATRTTPSARGGSGRTKNKKKIKSLQRRHMS